MDALWVLLLMVLGCGMLFKPELLWKIEHMFTVKGGEPTELYLLLMRIGGIFFIGSGAAVLLMSLTH